MDKEHMHLLINEEIYLVKEDAQASTVSENAPLPEKAAESKEQKPEVVTPKVEEEIILETAKAETSETTIPVAVFHESTTENELDLLQKIISACKLEPDTFQVYANGFNKEVKFKKALVFVASSKSYYTPIPYQGGEILCSRPLVEIQNNQEEKVKLWSALKTFF